MSLKAPCKEVRPWLKANLGKYCLAGLTTADSIALDSAVHLLELRNFCDQVNAADVVQAFRGVVMCMQPQMRFLAYHSIAFAGNWDDRAALWERAELPPLARPGRCLNEPTERREVCHD